jgi:hypothetical protein
MRGLRRVFARGELDLVSSCFGHKNLLDRWTKLIVGHPFDTIKVSPLSWSRTLRGTADDCRLGVSMLPSVVGVLLTASPMRAAGNISRSMALLHFDYQQGGECGVGRL